MKKTSVKLSDVLKFSFWGAKNNLFFCAEKQQKQFYNKKS